MTRTPTPHPAAAPVQPMWWIGNIAVTPWWVTTTAWQSPLLETRWEVSVSTHTEQTSALPGACLLYMLAMPFLALFWLATGGRTRRTTTVTVRVTDQRGGWAVTSCSGPDRQMADVANQVRHMDAWIVHHVHQRHGWAA